MTTGIAPPQRDLEVPFFHDPHTHGEISSLSVLETVVIYAGLGVTIDRTQLNWRGLVAGLLEDLGLTEAQQQAVFAAAGGSDIAAASIAFELYADSAGKNALKNMQKRMRSLLYPVHLVSDAGQLITALGTLMDAWSQAGKTVVVVTPNYEDELLTLLKGMTSSSVQEVHVNSGTAPADAEALLATPGMKYVYLHGSIPDTGPMTKPVLHERDYFESEESVRGFLTTLFRGASTLFIGTSLTDPPLVAALLGSQDSGHIRYSLHPLQASSWPTDLAERRDQVAYHDLRLRHLGVRGIYPDYFGQTAQFLHEVRECQRRGLPYEAAKFDSRYGQRLCRWWDKWSPKFGTAARQPTAHKALATLLDDGIRPILGTTEEMKIELWLRWEPEGRRQLALWASSTGTWRSTSTMRMVDIEAGSPWVAASIFTQGRIVRSKGTWGRWKHFAGVPLDYTEGDSPAVPIGAIVLASMSGDPKGALVDRSKSAALVAALELLQGAGQQILETGKYAP